MGCRKIDLNEQSRIFVQHRLQLGHALSSCLEKQQDIAQGNVVVIPLDDIARLIGPGMNDRACLLALEIVLEAAGNSRVRVEPMGISNARGVPMAVVTARK